MDLSSSSEIGSGDVTLTSEIPPAKGDKPAV